MAQCPTGHPNITAGRDKMGECLYQCEYKYHYGLANVRATHSGGYISISYQTQNKEFPVLFKGQEFSVSEMRIYSPSIHKFDGKNLDAELVIVHSLCSPGNFEHEDGGTNISWESLTGKTMNGTLGNDACFYTYDSLSTAKSRCIDPPSPPGTDGPAMQCDGIVNIKGMKGVPKCGNKEWQLRRGSVASDPSGGTLFTKVATADDSSAERDCPDGLYVCIPLSSSAPGASAESNILNTIIRDTLGLQAGYHTDVFSFDSPFNLNKFIPDERYFSYFGTGLSSAPQKPCANYVVFANPIGIGKELAKGLAELIVPSVMPVENNAIDLLHSQQAPESMTKSKGKTDDIYIDCQPTDDSGLLLVTEDKPGLNVDPVLPDVPGKSAISTFWTYFYKAADIFLGIFITMMIVMVVQGLLNPGSGVLSAWFWVKLVVLAMIVGYLSTVVAQGTDTAPTQGVVDYLNAGSKTLPSFGS